MLYLGDSIDRDLINNTCRYYNHSVQYEPKKDSTRPYNSLYYCKELKMAVKYVPGVHLDGPYLQRQRGVVTNFRVKTLEAKSEYEKIFGVSSASNLSPAMVVLGSNFWDIARLAEHEGVTSTAVAGLSLQQLHSYAQNLTEFIRFVKLTFPHAIIVYRTHSIAKHDIYGRFSSRHLRNHFVISVKQINVFGRITARTEGVATLDLEQMTSFFTPEVANADLLHPNPAICLQVVNLLLNIIQSCAT